MSDYDRFKVAHPDLLAQAEVAALAEDANLASLAAAEAEFTTGELGYVRVVLPWCSRAQIQAIRRLLERWDGRNTP